MARPSETNFMTDRYIDLIEAGAVPPRIYVLVNGGRYNIYDYGDSLGETAFVKELIPHIDGNYRTISTRLGRAIEGFSAGGAGTARIVFKYPELFCSATPFAGPFRGEKLVAEGRPHPPRREPFDLIEAGAVPPRIYVLVNGGRYNIYDYGESLGETAFVKEHVDPWLSHGTFRSTSMNVEVGYVIYLPPRYEDPSNAERRYPVVYHLHGGLQGSERTMANFMTDNYIDLIEPMP